MSRTQLYQWRDEIQQQLGLKKWQALGIALLSLGIVLAERCTLSKVAEKLGWCGKADSIERRLQRLLDNEGLDVEGLFTRWTGWVLATLGQAEVMLLVDETKLGKHLGVMMVGVAYRRCCIPLAWRSYQWTAYPAEGQVQMIATLLRPVQAGLPAGCRGLVQVDRGIGTSPTLVEALEALGLDYLLRVQSSTRFLSDQGQEYPLKQLVNMGEHWVGTGRVFKKHGWLRLHVYLYWELGYKDMWCLVSNRPDLHATTYAYRYWQEAGFRDLKSDGWNWQRSHVWQPDHAQRLILAMALAYAWMLSLGTLSADAPPDSQHWLVRGSRPRYSLFRLGLRYFALLYHHRVALPLKLWLVPEAFSKTVVT